jgi:hypothetical protein
MSFAALRLDDLGYPRPTAYAVGYISFAATRLRELLNRDLRVPLRESQFPARDLQAPLRD